jgi:hypothetical protein
LCLVKDIGAIHLRSTIAKQNKKTAAALQLLLESLDVVLRPLLGRQRRSTHIYHTSKKKTFKNIQQRGFASGHPPNY